MVYHVASYRRTIGDLANVRVGLPSQDAMRKGRGFSAATL